MRLYTRLLVCVTLGVAAITFNVNKAIAQQGVSINVTGTPPNATAMLDISSTNRGLLIPRMSATQKSAIVKPAKGLLVFQTDVDSGFWYYSGSHWVQLIGSDTSTKGAWLLAGNAGTNDTANFL